MITANIQGIDLSLETDPSVFCPNGVDRGTLAMLSAVELLPDDTVLDLGCGCGVVGIWAAKRIGGERVVLCDIQYRSVECARANAARNGVPNLPVYLSDGYENVPDREYSLILSNPPYHADFSVPKRFIEGGYRRLRIGGRFVMVTKRLLWYRNKMKAVFGGVRVCEIDGYYVFIAEKREKAAWPPEKPKNTLSRKLQRKQERQRRKPSGT